MPVKRSNHKSNYTKIPNSMMLDARLSVEAKGALACMLSRSPDWTFYHWELRQTLGIGREKFERIVDELIAAGYVSRSRVQPRDAYNRFLGYEYVICDVPSQHPQPRNGLPQRGIRRRKPDNNIKKDVSKIELSNSHPNPLSRDTKRLMVGEQYTDFGLAALDAGMTFVFENSEPYSAWQEFRGEDGLPLTDVVIKDGVERRGIWMVSLFPRKKNRTG